MKKPFIPKLAGDFPSLIKINRSFEGEVIQGFGGIAKNYPLRHRPILFIHGNGGDKNRFTEMAGLFSAKGYSQQELLAFSYMGEPARKNTAGDPHTKELPDLKQIIDAIIQYTKTDKIDIIAHSLGVTLTLFWMKEKYIIKNNSA